jgi:hypothetical protein
MKFTELQRRHFENVSWYILSFHKFIAYGWLNDALCASDYRASNETKTDEYWIGRNLEGSGNGLVGSLSRYSPVETEEYHEKNLFSSSLVLDDSLRQLLPSHQISLLHSWQLMAVIQTSGWIILQSQRSLTEDDPSNLKITKDTGERAVWLTALKTHLTVTLLPSRTINCFASFNRTLVLWRNKRDCRTLTI